MINENSGGDSLPPLTDQKKDIDVMVKKKCST
jgi:hypothetical protein